VALALGTRVGPYEVTSLIGAGGMGEVYKARDLRLDRVVAIKILPPQFADDAHFHERFDREARAISQLDHPNICTLHDVGVQDGMSYLVMQYLEGETLESRLSKGPLPIDQALQLAVQISGALDKAHRAGIVHRDLKPGNIMLTKQGAKLLDFGLAKATTAGSTAALSMLPTTPPGLTAQGTILGTFQYMSPEQLEGQDADERTDIFAFGAVLYETVTGRKAFEGKSQASLISAIMSSSPPAVSSLQTVAPPALDRVIATCLEKQREDRFQSARDLSLQLRWIAEGVTESRRSSSSSFPAPRGTWSRMLPAVAAALALLTIALAAWIVTHRVGPTHDPSASAVMRLSIVPSERTLIPTFAISPEGTRVVFSAISLDGGRESLWLRAFDQTDPRPLKGTEDGHGAFWSPDGRFIAFFADGKLKKMAVPDGSPQTIGDASGPQGGTWNQEGVILFVPQFGQAVQRVPASGGSPAAVTKIDPKDAAHLFPSFLPDGRHFLFYVRSAQADNQGVYVGAIDSPTPPVRVLAADTAAQYAAPGDLVFASEGALRAQAFDVSTLRASGDPTTLVSRVHMDTSSNVAFFSLSRNGVLAYRRDAPFRSQLVWVDRAGHEDVAATPDAVASNISLSADEHRVAVVKQDPQSSAQDIWLVDLVRGSTSKFSASPRAHTNPIWAPDGSRVVFATDGVSGGMYDLYEKPASGGSETALLKGDGDKVPDDWSRDGHYIVYERYTAATRTDLWVLPLTGDRKPMPFAQTAADEKDGRFSPDGKWIAYASDESGTNEVYVQPYPPTGAKLQVSTDSPPYPQARWSSDGRELFYVSADYKLVSVGLTYRGGFVEAAPPKALFRVGWMYDYIPSRDGRRMLFLRMTNAPFAGPIDILLNWTAALTK
jgi:serine/threonine protein kinase/Tol biopolymer transport system component